jgi:hypothetical protein
MPISGTQAEVVGDDPFERTVSEVGQAGTEFSGRICRRLTASIDQGSGRPTDEDTRATVRIRVHPIRQILVANWS